MRSDSANHVPAGQARREELLFCGIKMRQHVDGLARPALIAEAEVVNAICARTALGSRASSTHTEPTTNCRSLGMTVEICFIWPTLALPAVAMIGKLFSPASWRLCITVANGGPTSSVTIACGFKA